MMINMKFASPLFILRKQCQEDLFSVLEKVKEIGFDGVEFLGFFGRSSNEIRKKLDELHLIAIGNHVDYFEFIENIRSTIDFHKEIGCSYITISSLPKQMLTDVNAISEWIKNVTDIGNICGEQGITLLYHNHDFELKHKIGQKYLLEYLLDSIPMESLSFEPDLGWMSIGGAEPDYFLDKYRGRCRVIHLKDFYAEDTSKIGDVSELNSQKGDAKHSFFEFRPTGYGICNTPALVKKSLLGNPEWMVLDHDLSYDRNSYFDLKISLDYLKNLFLLL